MDGRNAKFVKNGQELYTFYFLITLRIFVIHVKSKITL